MSTAKAAEEQPPPTASGSTEKLPIVGNDDTPSSSSVSHRSSPPKSPEETEKSNLHRCKCDVVRSDVKYLLRDIKVKTNELMERAPLNGGLIHWTLQDAFITLSLIEGQLDGHIQEIFFPFFFRPQIHFT